MVGGPYFQENINLLREDGRLVYINAVQGDSVQLAIHQLMRKRVTVTGSTLRNRDYAFKQALAAEEERHVWPLIENGRFRPVIHAVFPLADAAEAHRLMESTSHTGKIVLAV